MYPTKQVKIDRLVYALALVPLLAVPAAAEGKKQTVKGDDMIVTATRTEERSIDVPVTTQVITRETIEMSGVADVGDLVGKYVTGHYHKYNGLLSPIGLRGFRTDAHGADLAGYVLILVDGHRIGTGNAAKINLDRIERVEVIKGPASALYGSAAMGGVVNLITKKGDGKLGGSVGGEYGSFDYYKTQVTGGGEVNEKFRFFATADIDDIGDYKDPTFGTVYNSGVEKKNIGGNFVYAFSERHELRLGGNYSDLTSESPSWAAGTYSSYVKEYDDHNDKSTGYADLEYNGDFFGGAVHWRGMAYYLWDKNHWFSGNSYGNSDPDSYQTKYIDETVGTDHQFTWKMTSWNSLLAGFTMENLEKKSYGVADSLPARPYTPGLDYDNQALFIQDSLDLLDNRVNIIAAARYDRFDVTTKRAETGSYASFNERSEDYSHVSPKVGVGVKLFDEKLRLRANAGEGFKSPTADQLSADYYHTTRDVHYRGNPDLDPETSMSYDIGFDLFFSPVTFKFSYFHTDYEDKIVSKVYSEGGQTVSTYENHGDATLTGFDIGVEWALDKTFRLPFTASLWSNMTFNTTYRDELTQSDLLYTSDYEIKTGLNIGYQGLSGQLSHALIGPQMIDNWDTYQVEEKGAFSYWDLTLRYRFDEHWEVKGSVLNLFDQEVEWVRGYLMPERNFLVGLTYNF
ncbi:TonB-dependent receptor plug domain-containing protein [Desulfobulbus elongatus]|uniref:TonB-dependent receptor plug domain-containing protein n=1 Tax=Desulfobulbus elongatus TaxID=53332 RepID=UPI0004821EC4|nr:TonB-dependent receptor [Desulfobulbus elongatus]